MYHAVLENGKVRIVKCDPREIDGLLGNGVLIAEADTIERLRSKLAKDPNGKLFCY